MSNSGQGCGTLPYGGRVPAFRLEWGGDGYGGGWRVTVGDVDG